MGLSLDRHYLKNFISDQEIESLAPQVKQAHEALLKKTGRGNDFLGWVNLPSSIDDKLVAELEKLGREVRKNSDCLISIGIGGSYLGIRATIEFLRDQVKFPVYYAGHNMSVDYLQTLFQSLKGKRVSVLVISKSGTTTEPALAFRLVKQFMAKKYSKGELKKRIICVTDAKKGALRKIVDQEGYRSYVIPDDVGGRFSVLTPVGLVPLAIAGVDIKSFVRGARLGEKEYNVPDIKNNPAHQYAAIRYLLYKKGRVIEVLSSFYDNLFFVAEWWKQLYGESEGKEGKGIFPASVTFSSDLHSMGQLLQDGMRNLFETFIDVEQQRYKINIPSDKQDLDGFNFVAGKDLDYVNQQAFKATAAAHYEGGVPNMTIRLAKSDSEHLGRFYYFFEKAVGVSGYLLGVNPFDQPGVEAYKKKMFELLGKK